MPVLPAAGGSARLVYQRPYVRASLSYSLSDRAGRSALHRRQLIRSSQLTHAVTADRRPLTTSRLQTECRRRGSDLVDETSLGDKIQASSYSGDRRTSRRTPRHATPRAPAFMCNLSSRRRTMARCALRRRVDEF